MPKSKRYLKKDKGKIEGNLHKILDTDNMYNLGICGRLINNHLFVNLGAQLWGLQDLMKKVHAAVMPNLLHFHGKTSSQIIPNGLKTVVDKKGFQYISSKYQSKYMVGSRSEVWCCQVFKGPLSCIPLTFRSANSGHCILNGTLSLRRMHQAWPQEATKN